MCIRDRDSTDAEINAIFNKVYGGTELTKEEILKFKSSMLIVFGEMDWEKGWTPVSYTHLMAGDTMQARHPYHRRNGHGENGKFLPPKQHPFVGG